MKESVNKFKNLLHTYNTVFEAGLASVEDTGRQFIYKIEKIEIHIFKDGDVFKGWYVFDTINRGKKYEKTTGVEAAYDFTETLLSAALSYISMKDMPKKKR